MTSDECPCVPTAQCQPEGVSDEDIRSFSAAISKDDKNNVIRALRVSPNAGSNNRYLWMGEQTFWKGPKAPISYNASFTGIGVFLSRIKFCPNLHLLLTVQVQLKSKSKRAPLRQAILPPEVTEGNEVTYKTANCSSPKGVTTQPKTP